MDLYSILTKNNTSVEKQQDKQVLGSQGWQEYIGETDEVKFVQECLGRGIKLPQKWELMAVLISQKFLLVVT